MANLRSILYNISITSKAGIVRVYWKGWEGYTLELRTDMRNSREAVNETVDRYNKSKSSITIFMLYIRAFNINKAYPDRKQKQVQQT